MNQDANRHYWILTSDPRQYHWDTLFVKGKEMWRGAGSRPQVTRLVKLMRHGDRVLAYHSTPDRWVYALAEVTRDPYPDPQDPARKALIIDLRALERLGHSVRLAEMKTNPLLHNVKFLKNTRLTISLVTEEEYREILRMGGIVPLSWHAAALTARRRKSKKTSAVRQLVIASPSFGNQLREASRRYTTVARGNS